MLKILRFLILLLLAFSIGSNRPPDRLPLSDRATEPGVPKGILLTKRYQSLEELKEDIQIEYIRPDSNAIFFPGKPKVRLTHYSDGRQVSCVLGPGISQKDFVRARNGNFWDRLRLVFISPYSVIHIKDLLRAYLLLRRRPNLYGEGDPAFYDIAQTMTRHITEEDKAVLDPAYFEERGFLNSFNHFTAQALTTSIFSERLAGIIANAHERYAMPELITGDFTEAQIADIDEGPVDNYVDVINNEWGQELGKVLKAKYHISDETYWTPQLMADYLNDVQNYFSWAFQIGFKPFRPGDEVVIRFAGKINRLLDKVPKELREV